MASGGCSSKASMPAPNHASWIESEVLGSSALLRGIRSEPERYKLQILVTELDQDGVRETWGYRADAEYFYPASTVKLPAAVATLIKLRSLAEEHGVNLTPDTPMRFHPQFEATEIEDRDASNIETQQITLRHLLRKVFLVSDNEAYNKMFELVGSNELNQLMQRVEPGGGRIVHRLSEGRTAQQNAELPAIDFLNADGTVLLSLPERISQPTFASDSDIESLPGYPKFELGRAYTTGRERVEEPFVFAGKNRTPLSALHRLVIMLAEPSHESGQLGLHESDRQLLVEIMQTLPRQSANPVYDPEKYPDEYPKFFLPGIRDALGHDQVLIANKLGRAYGFSIDAAHIYDERNQRAIVLSAVIYTNDNATLNDGIYEYALADQALAQIARKVAERLLAD